MPERGSFHFERDGDEQFAHVYSLFLQAEFQKRGAGSVRKRPVHHADPWILENLRRLRVELGGDATLRDLAGALESLGVPTARGGRWGPSAVRNVLRRLDATA